MMSGAGEGCRSKQQRRVAPYCFDTEQNVACELCCFDTCNYYEKPKKKEGKK